MRQIKALCFGKMGQESGASNLGVEPMVCSGQGYSFQCNRAEPSLQKSFNIESKDFFPEIFYM